MIKIKVDTSDIDTSELLEGVRSRFKAATSALMADVNQEAQRHAASKLKVGLKKWQEGFKMHKVTDDFYIVSIDGQLANWMEQGIKTGEVSKSIMQGNRATHNKSEGKEYVDVPITKDADSTGNITLGKKGPKVNVKAFVNADQLMKSINVSDWKRGGIKQKQVVQSRVKDIIKNVSPKSGKASFLTIRRVTKDSVWPKNPFEGAKVLEHLDKYIDANFDKIMERFL